MFKSSMITINFIASNAISTTVQAKTGQSLMEAAVAGGITGIAADCGGTLTCATCHVMVHEPFASQLPPADGEEQAMLGALAKAFPKISMKSIKTAMEGMPRENMAAFDEGYKSVR